MPKQKPSSFVRRFFLRIELARNSLIRKFKSILDIDIEYEVGSYSIALPAYHLLPLYQKHHSLYDRFLPHLVKFLEADSAVVDVGANCGDTLAAMLSANKALHYICIEPDDVFFSYLQKNIERLSTKTPDASIEAHKALIGKGVSGVSLDGSGGTKRAIIGGNSKFPSSKRLDSIVPIKQRGMIRLLKSDVDGFDYDVLDSAEEILTSNAPILYFECDIYQEEQNYGYRELVDKLGHLGYARWAIFDNFGDVLVRDASIDQVLWLIEYLWRQNTNKSTRTIYYFDLLAATEKDRGLVDEAVDSYVSQIAESNL